MGKQQRFEQLVQCYSTDMFRYALWLCGNREIAEDLVQEAFARAWKNLHQLKDGNKEKAWIMTIVRNENARRFRRKHPDVVFEQANELQLPIAGMPRATTFISPSRSPFKIAASSLPP